MNEKWFLDYDISNNWYIIPAKRRRQWRSWRKDTNDEIPTWVLPINKHINKIEFENPQILINKNVKF